MSGNLTTFVVVVFLGLCLLGAAYRLLSIAKRNREPWLARVARALMTLVVGVLGLYTVQFSGVRLPEPDNVDLTRPVAPTGVKPEDVQPDVVVDPIQELNDAIKGLDDARRRFTGGRS
jgi:hypothetical protein